MRVGRNQQVTPVVRQHGGDVVDPGIPMRLHIAVQLAGPMLLVAGNGGLALIVEEAIPQLLDIADAFIEAHNKTCG